VLVASNQSKEIYKKFSNINVETNMCLLHPINQGRIYQESLQLQQTHQESFLSANTSSTIADSLPTGIQQPWAHTN
jgi:hypothetical protein